MQRVSEKDALSEVPRILSRYLRQPEENLSVTNCGERKKYDFSVKAGRHTFLVTYKGDSSLAVLSSAVALIRESRESMQQNMIPLLAVPFMGESGRRLCEANDLSWVDLSGNAHIEASEMVVHVEGKPNRYKRVGRPSSVFAPKSSRLIRRLLIEHDRSFTQRELSEATGVGEGYTSRIVRRLEQNGFLVRDDHNLLRIRDTERVLEAWRGVYDFCKHHIFKGHIATRDGISLMQRIADVFKAEEIEISATGLTAAWLYTRHAQFRLTTFYVPARPPAELLAHLGFHEEERGANMWLVVPNDIGVHDGAEVRDGIRCVHPLQVYLDLKSHPERSEEAAAVIRRDYLTRSEDA